MLTHPFLTNFPCFRIITYFLTFIFTSVSMNHAADRDGLREQRMSEWRAARVGMFIHWGPYSVAAGEYQGKKVPQIGEWIMRNAEIPREEYAKIAMQFDAAKYDPQQWVDFAKKCGVRYMVVTAKHHDGFASFDSKVSDWNAVKASGAKRDLLRPLADVCHKSGMPLGFHYSQAQDWYHAGGGVYGKRWDAGQEGNFEKFLSDVSLPQLQELVTNYGPVFAIFADTPVNMTEPWARKFHDVLPAQTVVNDRMGGGAGDYWCQEEFLSQSLRRDGDWELCMTMNGTWGYKKEPTPWKTQEELLSTLITTVSRGGNFLLNVGPLADGTFPPQAVERWEYIGAWLAKHGDAIYGAGACSFIVPSWDGVVSMRIDENGDTHTYLHFFQSPEKNIIALPRFANELVKAEIMGRDTAVANKKTAQAWELSLADAAIQPYDVIHLHWKGAIKIDKTLLTWDDQGKMQATANRATLHGSTISRERSPQSPELNVGYWTEVKDSLSWAMEVPADAKVNTTWNIACDPASAGSEVALTANGKEIVRWKVPATKSWNHYQNIKGPSFELPAGSYELTLTPLTKPGIGIMNLRSVLLDKE